MLSAAAAPSTLDCVWAGSVELTWDAVAGVAARVDAGVAAAGAAVWTGAAAGAFEAWAAEGSDAAAAEEVLLLLLPRGLSPVFRLDSVSAEIDDSCALLPESRLWLMLGAAPLDDSEACANTSAGRAAARSMRSRQTPPILT